MLSYAPIHICKWSKVRLPFPSKLKHSWRFWIVSLGLTVFVVFDLLILSKISRLISFLDNHTSIACLSIHIIVVVFRYIKISSKKHQYLWPDIFSSVVVAGAGGCAALTRWRRTISEKTTKKWHLFFSRIDDDVGRVEEVLSKRRVFCWTVNYRCLYISGSCILCKRTVLWSSGFYLIDGWSVWHWAARNM